MDGSLFCLQSESTDGEARVEAGPDSPLVTFAGDIIVIVAQRFQRKLVGEALGKQVEGHASCKADAGE